MNLKQLAGIEPVPRMRNFYGGYRHHIKQTKKVVIDTSITPAEAKRLVEYGLAKGWLRHPKQTTLTS
jgi:hypothetical protein